MSLLTGKAKEEFENWIYKGFGLSIQEFNNRHSSDSNHIIIEWFDTLGIDINIQSDFERNFWCRILSDTSTVIVGPDFKSRSEAIEDGIKKANKIYNEI